MWKGWYGKEPFDLRLTVLRLLGRLPLIVAVTFMGTLVFGGGYYVKNILLGDSCVYAVTSVYRVEYAVEEEKDVGTVYINEMSWNTYVHSELFLGAVRTHLSEMADGGTLSGDMAQLAASCARLEDSELAGLMTAYLGSDLRMPSITVTAESPEKCVLVARAAESAMTGEIARAVREIEGIAVIDSGDSASEVIPDLRPARAFVLSGVLSCFFVVVVLLLGETGDDGIWLPCTLWRRYGLKTAGTVESREFAENIRYFFREKSGPEDGKSPAPRRIALCGVQGTIDAEEVAERIRQICGRQGANAASEQEGIVWIPLPSPLQRPQVCEGLREADGILLAVQAGAHAGRQVERTLELLAQQDCQVTGALLWAADEKLIRRYYAISAGNQARTK